MTAILLKRAAPAAAALTAILLLASCVLEEEYTGNLDGPRVAVIGDSITYFSVDELHDALDPDVAVRVAAAIGATFERGRDPALVLGPTEPDVAVVMLGTNDVWRGLTLAKTTADMEALLAEFTGACIVMATLNENTVDAVAADGALYDNVAASATNEVIRARADRVVEWDASANADAVRYLDGGTIHPTDEGSQLLASLVAEQVASCVHG